MPGYGALKGVLGTSQAAATPVPSGRRRGGLLMQMNNPLVLILSLLAFRLPHYFTAARALAGKGAACGICSLASLGPLFLGPALRAALAARPGGCVLPSRPEGHRPKAEIKKEAVRMFKGNIPKGYRMRVGVDIDNTVANLNEELVRRYNVSLEVYPSPDLPVGFFSTSEGLGLLAQAEPLPGAAEVLRSLSRAGHEIVYITSRPVLAINFTREWLKAWDFPCSGIVFVPRGFKKVFAACYGIDIFFEDDPAEAIGLQEAGTQVYVLAWPYNVKIKGLRIERFTSWEEIEGYVDCFSQYRMVL